MRIVLARLGQPQSKQKNITNTHTFTPNTHHLPAMPNMPNMPNMYCRFDLLIHNINEWKKAIDKIERLWQQTRNDTQTEFTGIEWARGATEEFHGFAAKSRLRTSKKNDMKIERKEKTKWEKIILNYYLCRRNWLFGCRMCVWVHAVDGIAWQ